MLSRKTRHLVLSTLILAAIAIMAGCGGKSVQRINVDENIDLSGEWNDVDSRQVAAALVAQSTSARWVANFVDDHGKRPTIIIGQVRNKTTEHIPVRTFMADLERSYINSGTVDVVASPEERDQIREERADQQEMSSVETMKAWGREQGADFMLIGEMNTLFDSEGGDQVKYYQVDCYFVNLETNVKVWTGYEKIKKFVSQSGHKI